jgi:5-methylcytosine-specific restriction protein A
MPSALLKSCLSPGCPALTPNARCAAHTREVDQRRGTASARGYGSRWSRYRAWYLRRNPLCGDRERGARVTDDSLCAREGRTVAATIVDHIVPVSGPTDPSFFDPTAHQSLCGHCHAIKRVRERRG